MGWGVDRREQEGGRAVEKEGREGERGADFTFSKRLSWGDLLAISVLASEKSAI